VPDDIVVCDIIIFLAVAVHLCRLNGERSTNRRDARGRGIYIYECVCIRSGIALISFRPGPTDSQRTVATSAKKKEYNDERNTAVRAIRATVFPSLSCTASVQLPSENNNIKNDEPLVLYCLASHRFRPGYRFPSKLLAPRFRHRS